MTNSELIDILSAADFETIGEFQADNYDLFEILEKNLLLNSTDVHLVLADTATKASILTALSKYPPEWDVNIGVLPIEMLKEFETTVCEGSIKKGVIPSMLVN